MRADRSDRNRRGIGSLSCFALAIFALAVGGLLYVAESHNADMRQLALAQNVPPLIEIAALGADDIGPVGEVRIVAQVDFTFKQQIGFDGVPGLSSAFMLPLLAAEPAGPQPEALGVLLYTGDAAEFDATSLEGLLTNIVGMGQYGPILELHGLIDENWQYGPLISRAFDGANRAIIDAPIILEPFASPRAIALQPEPPGANTIVAAGVAVFFVFAGIGLLGSKSPKTPKAKGAAARHMMLSAYAPEMVSGEDGVRALQKLLAPNGPIGADLPGGVYSPPKEGLSEFQQTTDPLDAYESEITVLEERLNQAAKTDRRTRRRTKSKPEPQPGPALTVHSNDDYGAQANPGPTAQLEAVETEPDAQPEVAPDEDPFVRRLERLK